MVIAPDWQFVRPDMMQTLGLGRACWQVDLSRIRKHAVQHASQCDDIEKSQASLEIFERKLEFQSKRSQQQKQGRHTEYG
mmetsp:Transcript_20908/g.37648  ORF Transcript_20908/g.37648 Transcript_20908/m.37648 type:complete len:80 (+) Transcript_20908:554-793(+)